MQTVVEGMAPELELLPCKLKALSSNPSTPNTKEIHKLTTEITPVERHETDM
jgi:hypothetical protein